MLKFLVKSMGRFWSHRRVKYRFHDEDFQTFLSIIQLHAPSLNTVAASVSYFVGRCCTSMFDPFRKACYKVSCHTYWITYTLKGNTTSSVVGSATSIVASSPSSGVNMSYSTNASVFGTSNNASSLQHNTSSYIFSRPPSSGVTISYSTNVIPHSISSSSFLMSTASIPAETCSIEVHCNTSK